MLDTDKVAENLANIKHRVVNSKVIKLVVITFLSFLLLAYLVPFFIDGSALKFLLREKFSKIFDADIVINGDVKVAFLPVPTIVANDVLLQNYKSKSLDKEGSVRLSNIYAKSIQIRFPFFRFSKNSFARKIVVIDAAMESYFMSHPPQSRQNKFLEKLASLSPPNFSGATARPGIVASMFPLSNLEGSATSLTPQIVIKNGEMVIYDRVGMANQIKMINLEMKLSEDGVRSRGDFISNEIRSNFELLVKLNSKSKRQDSFLKITSPIFNLRADGIFRSGERDIFANDFTGQIEAEILELKSFYGAYVGNSGIFYQKLKMNAKPIRIAAEIVGESKQISVKNLTIGSGLISGNGSIDIDVTNKAPIINANIEIDNLNIDSILSDEFVIADAKESSAKEYVFDVEESQSSKQNEGENQKERRLGGVVDEKESSTKPDLSSIIAVRKIKDFDLAAEVKIKNVKYLDGEIKNVDLYLTISKFGEIMILPMTFEMPGEAIFRVNGVVDNSSKTPKFVGKIDAKGKSLKDLFTWLGMGAQNLKFDSLKDYDFYASILLFPNAITLSNIHANLNNVGSNITGEVIETARMEIIGDVAVDRAGKTPTLLGNFQVNNFVIDDHFLTSEQNTYLSPGMLTKKFLWLSNLSSHNDLTMRFDKLSYRGESFVDQVVKLRFGRGYFEIPDIELKSDKRDLKANFALDVTIKPPKFDFSIVADNLIYDTAQKSKLVDSKIIVTDEKNLEVRIVKKHDFFDQFFSLPSLEGFDGNISLNFNKLRIDQTDFSNVKLTGRLKDGKMQPADFSCNVYGGSLSYRGSIGIKLNKVIEGELLFKNALLQPMLHDLFGIDNLSGVANISASLASLASDKREFARHLAAKIAINTNAPAVYGYGLQDLIKKLFTRRSDIKDPHEVENILLNPKAKTVFKQANGIIQIDGGKGGTLRLEISAPAVNSVLSGSFNLADSNADLLFRATMLAWGSDKQVPLNIATSIMGNFFSLSQATNFSNVNQYLGLEKIPDKLEPSTLP